MKNVRAIAAVWAVVILLLIACGCHTASSSTPSEAAKPLPEEIGTRWYYSRLNDAQQENYTALYWAVRNSIGREVTVSLADGGAVSTEPGVRVALPQPLRSADEVRRLYVSLLRDNPDFFFISNTYTYEGEQVGDDVRYTEMTLIYFMDLAQRQAASTQLEAVLETMLDGIDTVTDEFEKELLLHDRLAARCAYHTEAAASDQPSAAYPQAFTAYGAIAESKAVCEGYAYAMQLLLMRAGLNSTLVSGFDLQGNTHMWNLVTVDKHNYYLDVTWNDSAELLQYGYFNITSADMLRTHRLDEDNLGADSCTAEDANYYRRKNAFIASYTLEDIARNAADQLAVGNTVQLRFASEVYQNGLLFIRTEDWFAETVNHHLKPKGKELTSYQFQQDSACHSVTLQAVLKDVAPAV